MSQVPYRLHYAARHHRKEGLNLGHDNDSTYTSTAIGKALNCRLHQQLLGGIKLPLLTIGIYQRPQERH